LGAALDCLNLKPSPSTYSQNHVMIFWSISHRTFWIQARDILFFIIHDQLLIYYQMANILIHIFYGFLKIKHSQHSLIVVDKFDDNTWFICRRTGKIRKTRKLINFGNTHARYLNCLYQTPAHRLLLQVVKNNFGLIGIFY